MQERLACIQQQLNATRAQLAGGAPPDADGDADVAPLATDIAALQRRHEDASQALVAERAKVQAVSSAEAAAECAPRRTSHA